VKFFSVNPFVCDVALNFNNLANNLVNALSVLQCVLACLLENYLNDRMKYIIWAFFWISNVIFDQLQFLV